MRFNTRGALVVGVLLAAAGVAVAGQPVNESRPVMPGAEIQVENLAGSLTIEGWSSDTVEVTGTLGHGVEELQISVDEENGEVFIEVEYDEDYHGRQEDATELTIMVPAGSPLSVETVSASISVTGLSSAVDLETVSGTVLVGGSPESLDVESVSGSVGVESAPAGTNIESVSGRIEIGAASGQLDVENVSGPIVIKGGTLGDADLESVSGDIQCHAVVVGDLDVETMSGAITLLVDPQALASYEVSTFSGEIRNDIGPEPERTSTYTPGQELVFNTGAGGPDISLSSFSGVIALEVR